MQMDLIPIDGTWTLPPAHQRWMMNIWINHHQSGALGERSLPIEFVSLQRSITRCFSWCMLEDQSSQGAAEIGGAAAAGAEPRLRIGTAELG